LHVWMRAFGDSLVAVRSLSLLFGVVSIAAVYLLGYEIYDQQTGLIAALLVSLSTFHIQYSQTARMYSMLFFFGVLSMLFYLRCLRDHSLDNRFGYAITTMAMLLTHPYGSFVLLGEMIHLGTRLWKSQNRQHLKRWFGTESLAVAPFIPWLSLVAFNRYFLGSGAETRWLSAAGLADLKNVIWAYVGVPINYPTINLTSYAVVFGWLFGIGVTAVVCARIYTEWRSEQEIRPAILFGSVLLGLVVIPFVISATVFPFFANRYVFVGLVAVLLLVAKSISGIESSTIRYTALALVVLASISMLPMFYAADHAEPWDEATSQIKTTGDTSLVVTIPGFVHNTTDYHLGQDSSVDTIRYGKTDALERHLTANDSDSVWAVVRTRGPGRDPIQWSMPAGYDQVGNESLGRLRLIKFEPNTTAIATNDTTEVAP